MSTNLCLSHPIQVFINKFTQVVRGHFLLYEIVLKSFGENFLLKINPDELTGKI